MNLCHFLVIDKPAGITSHDVVAAVRAVTGVKKVGHTGTLDPFATGVLPVALGKATRLIQYLDESLKIYDATIRFGAAMDTGDPTGTVVREAPVPDVDDEGLRAVLDDFLGPQQQTPPPYSAVKVKGKPLYHYARKGIEVTVPPRKITIHRLEVLGRREAELDLRIHCSRGTYARVLADDIATALGSAGHLSALCRVRSGPFVLEEALPMSGLSEMVSTEPGRAWNEVLMSRGKREERVPWRSRADVFADLRPRLLDPLAVLGHLPLVDCPEDQVMSVRNGGRPPEPPAALEVDGRYLVMDGATVLCLARKRSDGGAETLLQL